MSLRRLTPVKLRDLLETLAEHALDTGLKDWEVADEFKKTYLELVLDLNGGNQRKTARQLGVHRNTINRQMNMLGIERKGYMASRGNRREIL